MKKRTIIGLLLLFALIYDYIPVIRWLLLMIIFSLFSNIFNALLWVASVFEGGVD